MLQLSHRLVKQQAFPLFFFKAMQDTVQSQSRITVCLFTLAVTVLANPNENWGQARLCAVDQLSQTTSAIKIFLSVLLSPLTQRALPEVKQLPYLKPI